MALVALALFFVVLGIAGALNLTHDSRDSVDWAPTEDGFRADRSGLRIRD